MFAAALASPRHRPGIGWARCSQWPWQAPSTAGGHGWARCEHAPGCGRDAPAAAAATVPFAHPAGAHADPQPQRPASSCDVVARWRDAAPRSPLPGFCSLVSARFPRVPFGHPGPACRWAGYERPLPGLGMPLTQFGAGWRTRRACRPGRGVSPAHHPSQGVCSQATAAHPTNGSHLARWPGNQNLSLVGAMLAIAYGVNRVVATMKVQPGNRLVDTPGPDRIASIAGGGRQQVIRKSYA